MLWSHQEAALAFCADKPGSMLAFEVGTGKTRTALALAACWNAERILVACPLSVVSVWPKEIEKFYPGRWRVLALDGAGVKKKAAAARVAMEQRGPLVVCVNFESVWRPPFRELALSTPWDLVICDESQRCKAPGGKLSRFMADLGLRAKRRLGLTGTPLAHSLLDAYAQFRFLDRSVFGTSFARFRLRYALMGGYGNHQVVGFQNTDEFMEKFSRIAIQARKQDVLDLPEEIHTDRTCHLEPEARLLYNGLEEEFWAQVDTGEVTVANALVKLLRLQQISSGALKLDDGSLRRVSDAKERLLEDVLEDLDEPVVVFGKFTSDLDIVHSVAERLGRKSGEVSGRRKDLDRACFPDGIDVLAVQTQAGGVGIDLSKASVGIFYSEGFSLSDHLQCCGRLHRPGQRNAVTFIHLLVEQTVDVKVFWALRQREEVIAALLRSGRREAA